MGATTTQDVTDTATVLQIREGLEIVEAELAAISRALADLARKHRDAPVIGRSNLQQAIPVTFGYKMATILAAIDRHRERLAQLKPRVLVGAGALKQARFILEGLEVDPRRMRRNIDLTHGLVMSEAVMMGLGRHIDLVYDLCRQAIREDRPLIDLLAAHPEIGKHADRIALEKMCDPASYLGQAGVMVDRVLARTATLHAS